ncbi:DUF2325 domain-containing protein [Herbaspirillum lusitanum]|uniref:DUF2325 domain-containing protein n=1 Tax=Herbaspirillum lusitanum TaxID=213312 RepID=A0ABW9AHB3_9BURK
MSMHIQDVERLEQEQRAMVSHLARVQLRCSAVIQEQAAEIAQLRAQAMQMRAAIIARDTALAWAYEDRAALEAAIPDLPQRATLARRVKELSKRLQDLMRDKLRPTVSMPAAAQSAHAVSAVPAAKTPQEEAAADAGEISALEASIVAADLVICQTGCLSHGAYWRVQDHCKRTGKTCMMVAQPASVRIVRIHQNESGAHSTSVEQRDAQGAESHHHSTPE